MKLLFVVLLIPVLVSAQWVKVSPSNSGVFAPVLATKNTVLTVKDSYTPLYSTNSGTSWTQSTGMSSVKIATIIYDGVAHYAGTDSGVYKSTNNGVTWFGIKTGMGTGNSNIVTGISSVNGVLIAGTKEKGVFRSTNNGTEWTAANTGITEIFGLYCRAMTTVNSVALVATTSGIYRSLDNGVTWGIAAGDPGDAIDGFTVTSGNVVFAYSQTSVYRSSDAGNNWVNSSSGITTASSALILTSIGSWKNTVFAGTSYVSLSQASKVAVYRSTDGGTTWESIMSNLAVGTPMRSLSANDSALFLGSSDYVGKRPIAQVTAVKQTGINIPSQLSLAQNYPNPFNPSTRIDFTVPQNGFVSLKVYDAVGREVASLVQERMNAGMYSTEFNGGGFSSGVYFYRLMSGAHVSMKKMILLK